MTHPIYDTNASAEWPEFLDVSDWRNRSEPAGHENDDDDDVPVTTDVKTALGIDPDEIDWDGEEGE